MTVKKLMGIFFVITLVFVLIACASESTSDPSETEPDSEQITEREEIDENAIIDQVELKQSPMLDERNLPPVEERLPLVPKVANEMNMDYEIGRYGGTLRFARDGVNSDTAVFILQNEPLLNSPSLLGEEVTGNILREYEVSDDQMDYTFYMREGLKWSDGQPVTVEDVQFAVEDVLLNEELTPGGLPPWLKSGGKASGTPMEFEVIDEFTFKISFDEPYGGFPIELSLEGWRGYTELLKPKHFLRHYHIDYTPLEELEPLIEENSFEPGQWSNLFNLIAVTNWQSSEVKAIDFPVLSPYIVVSHGDIIEFERNPYYFKIDTEGNQLPYIDRVQSYLVQDAEMAIVKIMAGEVDHSYEFVDLPRVPLLKENEETGGYTLYMTELHRTANDVHLNLTYDDPVWREVVRDIRFRKALNLGLDKQEISDAIFYGFAEPSPMQGTSRDIEEANRLLDEMGLAKGADGYRIGPDGQRFTIPIEAPIWFTDIGTLGELVVEQWREIGIHVTVKMIDQALWSQRNAANELQATIIFTSAPVMGTSSDWGQQFWAPLWNNWTRTNGAEGEEPPPEVKALNEAIASLRHIPLEEAPQRRAEIREMIGEHQFYFVHTENIALPVAVNSKIGNFADEGWGIAHSFGGEMWFYRE